MGAEPSASATPIPVDKVASNPKLKDDLEGVGLYDLGGGRGYLVVSSQGNNSYALFRRAEADLHNLVPVIGELNGDRSNYAYGWLPQAPNQYGACPMVVDFKARLAMPRKEVRGTVARTYLYMSQAYQLRLSSHSRQLYSAWDKAYPAQPWERQRNQRIGCVMGWGNPFVPGFDASRCEG